ncbi:MAG: DUF4442 domain-containing protein [Ghiorsea sp.]
MSAQTRILKLWLKLGNSTFGRFMFSRLLGLFVPYSGSVRPLVLQLKPGYSLVQLKEHRGIRNHLRSVHAIALANVGELASGLAMLVALPDDVKAIVVKLDIQYLKKARGTLLIEGFANPPKDITEAVDSIATAIIKDEEGDVVAKLDVFWKMKQKDVDES